MHMKTAGCFSCARGEVAMVSLYLEKGCLPSTDVFVCGGVPAAASGGAGEAHACPLKAMVGRG